MGGEGNRLYFFWFLAAQNAELTIFLVQGVMELVRRCGFSLARWLVEVPLLLLGLATIAMLLIMVACLFSFHVYLASVNLTTWENISWHRISYLRGIETEAMSPFSRSLSINFALYCCQPWCPFQ